MVLVLFVLATILSSSIGGLPLTKTVRLYQHYNLIINHDDKKQNLTF